MELQLIDGAFSPTEIMDILTQLFHVKIKFHEDKVKNSNNEEDIKMRERKIKLLQKNLDEVRDFIKRQDKDFHVESVINILN